MFDSVNGNTHFHEELDLGKSSRALDLINVGGSTRQRLYTCLVLHLLEREVTRVKGLQTSYAGARRVLAYAEPMMVTSSYNHLGGPDIIEVRS